MRRRASSPHLTQSLDPTRHSVIGPNPTHDIAKKHSTQPNPWMDPIQPNLWMDPNKPNPTQPDPFGRTQPNPIQPDPWMDTTQHDPWIDPTKPNPTRSMDGHNPTRPMDEPNPCQSLCVHMSVSLHIAKTTCPNVHPTFVHAVCGRVSCIFWRRCDICSISGLWTTSCLHVTVRRS